MIVKKFIYLILMPGALLQIAARGEQNKFLDTNPEIYLFKTKYKRHGGFSLQTFEMFFNVTNFGETTTCCLLQDADLITNITLKVQLPTLNINKIVNTKCTKDVDLTCFCNSCHKNNNIPTFGWANSIGHLLLEEYSFNVGSKTIDKRTGEWLEWWSEFAQTSEKKSGYWEMIGKREPATFKPTTFNNNLELLIPLSFYFTGKIGHSFPLCAVDEDTVSVTIKWTDFNKCWISNMENTKPGFIPQINASLLVEYAFIDNCERNKFQNNNHLYLIEQIQKNGPTMFNKYIKQPDVDLYLGQPVKSLYWAVRRTDINKFSNDKDDPSCGNDWYNYSCYKSRTKNHIMDPINTFQLYFNGDPREMELPSKFYRLLQPYYRHTKTPSNYIYNYSFSFFPEDNQPSGTCNMSMFNSIRMKIKINESYPTNYEVISYAISYNFLIIKNKKISLAFII